jgi:hypothetical protein
MQHWAKVDPAQCGLDPLVLNPCFAIAGYMPGYSCITCPHRQSECGGPTAHVRVLLRGLVHEHGNTHRASLTRRCRARRDSKGCRYAQVLIFTAAYSIVNGACNNAFELLGGCFAQRGRDAPSLSSAHFFRDTRKPWSSSFILQTLCRRAKHPELMSLPTGPSSLGRSCPKPV